MMSVTTLGEVLGMLIDSRSCTLDLRITKIEIRMVVKVAAIQIEQYLDVRTSKHCKHS
uniref:Uncharacterized protein At2g30030 n=1 Tax=Arabidopsis thaliana TaxID=3702 RepID=O80870_ARATH|nr:hypothetical protein [Arabidopsis thaliana]